jgi:hypothetical protein
MGEVVDLINASANWEAYLLGGLRADASAARILDQAEAHAKLAYGLMLYADTSGALDITLGFSPLIAAWRNESNISNVDLTKWQDELYAIVAKNTFDSGTNLIKIYEIDDYRKTERMIFQFAGAATTVEAVTNWFRDSGGLRSTVGKRLIVRAYNADHMTGYLGIAGSYYQPII